MNNTTKRIFFFLIFLLSTLFFLTIFFWEDFERIWHKIIISLITALLTYLKLVFDIYWAHSVVPKKENKTTNDVLSMKGNKEEEKISSLPYPGYNPDDINTEPVYEKLRSEYSEAQNRLVTKISQEAVLGTTLTVINAIGPQPAAALATGAIATISSIKNEINAAQLEAEKETIFTEKLTEIQQSIADSNAKNEAMYQEQQTKNDTLNKRVEKLEDSLFFQ